MQIGINLANHRDVLSKRYIHDTARMAEDLGFDSVWIPDHAPAQLQTTMATLAILSQQIGRQMPALCPRFTVRVRETASDSARQFMEGSSAQITADLRQIQA